MGEQLGARTTENGVGRGYTIVELGTLQCSKEARAWMQEAQACGAPVCFSVTLDVREERTYAVRSADAHEAQAAVLAASPPAPDSVVIVRKDLPDPAAQNILDADYGHAQAPVLLKPGYLENLPS